MKKVMTLLLCFVLLLGLCACGSQDDQDASANNAAADNAAAAPADGDVADDSVAADDGDAAVSDSANDAASAGDDAASDDAADTTEDMVELVRSYIDKPIEELYAVIGEPESSDYAPSCMGDGDDGMLFYDGFIVYTYREGDTETVYDVE